MSFGLFLPRRWTRQPQGPVCVGDFFEFRPTFVYYPLAGGRDVASGRQAVYRKGASQASIYGIGNLKSGNTSTDPATLIFSNNPTWIQTQEITIFALVWPRGGGNSGYVITRANGSVLPSWGIGVYRGSVDGPFWQITGTVSNFSTFAPTAGWTLSDSEIEAKPLFLALTFKNGEARAFLNGKYVTGGTGLGNIDYSRTDQALVIGGKYNIAEEVFGADFQGYTYIAGTIDGAIPDAGIAALAENPYQIIRPERPKLFFLPPLFDKLNEETPNDNTYVSTSDLSTFEVALNAVDDPMIHTDHILKVRAKKTGTGKGVRVRLMQGSTVIDTWELK